MPDRFTNPQSLFQATDEQTSGAFVSRIKADGSSYVYSTYLVSSQPGTFGSYGSGIAADADGNAYVTGYTHDGLPVVAAIQNRPGMAPGSSNASMPLLRRLIQLDRG